MYDVCQGLIIVSLIMICGEDDEDAGDKNHVDLACHPYTYFTCGVSFA